MTFDNNRLVRRLSRVQVKGGENERGDVYCNRSHLHIFIPNKYFHVPLQMFSQIFPEVKKISRGGRFRGSFNGSHSLRLHDGCLLL